MQNLTLHYLTDGSCTLMFSRNRELFFVPVVLILKVSGEGTCMDDCELLTCWRTLKLAPRFFQCVICPIHKQASDCLRLQYNKDNSYYVGSSNFLELLSDMSVIFFDINFTRVLSLYVCTFYSVCFLNLQALMDAPDVHIYNEVIKDDSEDTFLKGLVNCWLQVE